jgi:peptidoglycan/xylan/chitin deacetylase (PgdA/CDA1 family)
MGTLNLTLDDGPDPRGTPQVLDALAAAGAHATFFVLGSRAAAHPELVERVLAEGHAVGLHGHEHLRHPGLSRAVGEADTDRALGVLGALGVEPSRWRTPWGEEAEWTREVATERGLDLVHWDADTHDWRGDPAPAMLAAVAPRLRDGAIVLAHDGLGPGALRDDCDETAALVGSLVAAGRELGLEPRALP